MFVQIRCISYPTSYCSSYEHCNCAVCDSDVYDLMAEVYVKVYTWYDKNSKAPETEGP